MKHVIFCTALVAATHFANGQQNWSTNLNNFSVSGNPLLGTSSNHPIKFITSGTQRMSLGADGTLMLNGLAGDGERLVTVDGSGNFRIAGGGTTVFNCSSFIIPWYGGGNKNMGSYNTVGTCDANDFILKANDIPLLFLKSGSSVNVGINNSGSSPAIFDVSNGYNYSATTPYHTRIYGDNDGSIESTGNTNFYTGDFNIKTGLLGSGGATRLSVDGTTGTTKVYYPMLVGANMPATPAQLGVDARTAQGIAILSGGGNDALNITNSAGAARFRIWTLTGGNDDTKFHLAGSSQVGFYQGIGMADPNVRFNVDALGSSLNGVKVTSNSNSVKSFYASNNGVETFVVNGDGRTQIGAPVSGGIGGQYWLTVNGKVGAREVLVTLASPWPDYVFETDYKLNSLDFVEKYVAENKHLPNIPCAAELKSSTFGLNLGEIQGRQMEKIEEIYLHLIELNKEKKELKKQVEDLLNTVAQQAKTTEMLQKEMEMMKEKQSH